MDGSEPAFPSAALLVFMRHGTLGYTVPSGQSIHTLSQSSFTNLSTGFMGLGCGVGVAPLTRKPLYQLMPMVTVGKAAQCDTRTVIYARYKYYYPQSTALRGCRCTSKPKANCFQWHHHSKDSYILRAATHARGWQLRASICHILSRTLLLVDGRQKTPQRL